MATDEEAYEAVYDAVVRLAPDADVLCLKALAAVLDTLAEAPSDKPEAPVLLSGADMLHVDPSVWYGDRGIGFTPGHLPKSNGHRPKHAHPDVFS